MSEQQLQLEHYSLSLSLTTGISAQSCNLWKNNLKDCMVLMSIWDGEMIEKWEELHSTDIIPEN